MNLNDYNECGIKYEIIKISANNYILYPIASVVGIENNYDFVFDNEKIPILIDKDDLKNKYVISSIYSLDDLKMIYDFYDDDKFIIDYYTEVCKNTLLFVKTNNNEIIKTREIDLDELADRRIDVAYLSDNNIPAVVLNNNAFDDLLNSNNLNTLKLKLKQYKGNVEKFVHNYEPDGVTKIHVSNGKIKEIETSCDIESDIFNEYYDDEDDFDYEDINEFNNEVSYNGLRNFIKERIKGHDEEIDIFAQKLYMNYTALDGEAIESILLVGPTGTGKTETVNAVCSYLNIPSIIINASNLVPNGYKGMCLEDALFSLYLSAKSNITKAERGIVFLDEMDKLNDSELDLKTIIKNILLTFNAGGEFFIGKDDDIAFNSCMTNKVYAGVFDRIKPTKGTVLGFNNENNNLITYQNIRQKIVDKNYFSLEELSRISTILMFDELSNDVKKEILLYSKLSELSKKTARYKRQFGIDLVYDNDFIDAVISSVPKNEGGMRTVNNLLKDILNVIERKILECDECNYKKLVLTRDTVLNSNNFDLS